MNVLGVLLNRRGQRRGPRRVRITPATPPRHAVPKPPIDWMVSPCFDICPEVDAIGYDLLLGLHNPVPADPTPREAVADCGTPDPDLAELELLCSCTKYVDRVPGVVVDTAGTCTCGHRWLFHGTLGACLVSR